MEKFIKADLYATARKMTDKRLIKAMRDTQFLVTPETTYINTGFQGNLKNLATVPVGEFKLIMRIKRGS